MSTNETNSLQKEMTIGGKWFPPVIENLEAIPKGDMPGDKIKIGDGHIEKANAIFPRLLELLVELMKEQASQKVVIAVHGGSGVGKSEIGSLLAYYLNNMNIGSYVLSGDNYPRRIPKFNDAERLRTYRESGLKGLVTCGEYTKERHEELKELQENEKDFDPGLCQDYSWLFAYQEAGKLGLKKYLGTTTEIDFQELNSIISQFKSGVSGIMLKRMGREEKALWYDAVDFNQIKVLVIEWTHGNNQNLKGVDIPILLNSTPQETLEHRRLRNRDGKVDSPFTTIVLSIEQEMLVSQAGFAKIIVLKSGDIVSYDHYKKLMENE